jgi:hypothetical protein
MRRTVVSAISGRGLATSNYRFRSFDSEEGGETLLMSFVAIIDEHRAAAVIVAVALVLLTAFIFGYGAGGAADTALSALTR